ncbi:MAG: hypothetical protein KDE29_16200 [Anaerolineales bacterium]|nr:hypothetical protein [Anaerolineales bacterium]
MTVDTRLLFYGDSIFLAGLKAELATAVAHDHPLRLLTLPTDSPNPLQTIRDYHPQVLLFDLTAPSPPDFVIPLLRQQPDLLLIGLDPSRDDLLLLSSQSAQAIHINDLLTLLQRQEATS